MKTMLYIVMLVFPALAVCLSAPIDEYIHAGIPVPQAMDGGDTISFEYKPGGVVTVVSKNDGKIAELGEREGVRSVVRSGGGKVLLCIVVKFIPMEGVRAELRYEYLGRIVRVSDPKDTRKKWVFQRIMKAHSYDEPGAKRTITEIGSVSDDGLLANVEVRAMPVPPPQAPYNIPYERVEMKLPDLAAPGGGGVDR